MFIASIMASSTSTTTRVTTTGNADKLLRRMAEMELLINSLVDKLYDGGSLTLRAVIKDKMNQLEEMVAELPSCAHNPPDVGASLATEWRGKLVRLWERYSLHLSAMIEGGYRLRMLPPPVPEASSGNPSSTSAVRCGTPPPVLTSSIISKLSWPPALPQPDFRNLNGHQHHHHHHAFACSGGGGDILGKPQLSIGYCGKPASYRPTLISVSDAAAEVPETGTQEFFLASIAKQLTEFEPIQDGDDILGLKKLCVLVARLLKQSFAYPDRSLKSSLFELVWPKLPEVKQREFRAYYGDSNTSLKCMITFLKGDIITQLRDKHSDERAQRLVQALGTFNETQKSQPSSSSSSSSSVGDSIEGKIATEYYTPHVCQYCKKMGHVTFQCAELKNQLCFNCFQFGHRNKECPNEPLFYRR